MAKAKTLLNGAVFSSYAHNLGDGHKKMRHTFRGMPHRAVNAFSYFSLL
jgi:hypothetical protein